MALKSTLKVRKTKFEIVIALNAADIAAPAIINIENLNSLFQKKITYEYTNYSSYVVTEDQIDKFISCLDIRSNKDSNPYGLFTKNASHRFQLNNFISNGLQITNSIHSDIDQESLVFITKLDIVNALVKLGLAVPNKISIESVTSVIKDCKSVSNQQIADFLYILGLIQNTFTSSTISRDTLAELFTTIIVITDENNIDNTNKGENSEEGIDMTFDSIQAYFQQINENNNITQLDSNNIPYDLSEPNIIYYTSHNSGVDVTKADNIWLRISEEINDDLYMIITTEDDLPATVVMFGSFLKENGTYYLEAKGQNIFLDFSSSNLLYYLVFSNKDRTKHYAVEITIQTEKLATDDYYLCIDFGTSNTTAGTWQKDTQEPTLVEFDDVSEPGKPNSYLLPTIAYVESAESDEDVHFLFGYEAKKRLIETDYQPKGSIFYNIKQWVSLEEDYTINCHDESNHSVKLQVHDIISAYLRYVVSQAEIKLKKRFVKFHFSAPVKLKARLYEIVCKTFKNTEGYTIVPPNESLDEAIAIVYERISELRELESMPVSVKQAERS